MKKIFLFLSIITSFLSKAQDPVFTNVNHSLVYLNPSFSGSNGFIRNQASYRNQWPSLSGTYISFYNSFDMYLNKIKGGVALNYLHDDQARGTLMTDFFNITYAQYFYLCDKNLKIIPSIQAGGFIKRLDKTKLTFSDPYYQNGRTCPWGGGCAEPSSKKSNFDFSTGLLVNYKRFYFGTSVFHITQPDEGLYGVSKLPYHLSIHSSYNVFAGPKTLFNFFVRFDKQQNFEYVNLKVNALLMNHIVIGAGISSGNTLNTNIGYRNNLFVLSLGYDVSSSQLSQSYANTWEFQASYNLRNKENRKAITNFETW